MNILYYVLYSTLLYVSNTIIQMLLNTFAHVSVYKCGYICQGYKTLLNGLGDLRY